MRGRKKLAKTEKRQGSSRTRRNESDARVVSEAADVVYHVLVGLRARGVPMRDVLAALEARAGRSGLAEKASRAADTK